MNDQETRDLCRQVYERLGWDEADFRYIEYKLPKSDKYDKPVLEYMPKVENERIWSGARFTPAYSLEYVLDKLPMFSKFASKDAVAGEVIKVAFGRLTLTYADNGQRVACYVDKNTSKWLSPEYGDTPLQAALRLVLALADAGVLS